MNRVLLLCLLLGGCVTQKKVKQSEARTNLGTAYLRENNTPGAVLELRKATQYNPQNPLAWERLGLAYMASNALPDAENAFKKAIRLTSKNNGGVHYNYGMLLIRMRRHEDAIEQFKATLSDLTYRKPTWALNSLGFSELQLGKYDQAIVHLNDAIRRSPKFCPALLHRGVALHKKKKLQAALSDFEAVILNCGDEAMGAYFHAAPVLFALDQKEAGCDYLSTAQKKAPNTGFARKAAAVHAKECKK